MASWHIQVGTLLQSQFLEIRILGARLLAAFVHVQVRCPSLRQAFQNARITPLMTRHLFPGSTPCCQNPVGTNLLAMLKPCVQAGLDYSQHLQIFVPLLCEGLPGASGHLVSLRGQEFSAQSADLTVASLGALREYILFRCAPKPAISHICTTGRFLCI